MNDPRAAAFRATWAADADQVPAEFFDRLYDVHEDPWALAERWYERRKYDLTAASLPKQQYGSGLEIGCSVGLLTERLAARCRSLLALDIASSAVETTRRRCTGLQIENVEVRQMAPPDEWPCRTFDLIVLSEVLYFCAGQRLDAFIEGAVARLGGGGQLVAVHERLAATAGLNRLVHHVEDSFVLEVFERVQASGS
jgi:cyclopropane fatty-acyl-phospholipid synthase-like methyltransferase